MKKQHVHVAIWVAISLGLTAYASSVEDDTPAAATPASSSTEQAGRSELYEDAYDIAVETGEEALARGVDPAGFAASGGEICDGVAAEVATMYDFTSAEQYEYMRGCIDGYLSVADR